MGDLFQVNGAFFRITDFSIRNRLLSVLPLWRSEGFASAWDTLEWMKVHYYHLPFFVRTFKRFDDEIFLCSEECHICYRLYDSIKGRFLPSREFEELYRLDSGNLLEVHEWADS